MFIYEHRSHALLSPTAFAKRVVWHLFLAFGLIGVGLGIGVIGYHVLGKLDWIDALLNASMILSGMGPIDKLNSSTAKIFASCYALFSGLMFVGATSVLVAPFIHRLLHRFHVDSK